MNPASIAPAIGCCVANTLDGRTLAAGSRRWPTSQEATSPAIAVQQSNDDDRRTDAAKSAPCAGRSIGVIAVGEGRSER
jgi:hypothetical protein